MLLHIQKKPPVLLNRGAADGLFFLQPDLLSLFRLWRASSDAIDRGCSFLPVSSEKMMARRRTKKKSNKLFKTAILLILFIGIWFIYQYPGIQDRIREALLPHKPIKITSVQTVPEPQITPSPEPTGIPTGKAVSYTIRNPQFDNLSYGVPGAADTIIEREGYALGYIEKHEQPAWVQYIMTAEEVSGLAAKRGDDFRPDPEVPTGSATPQDYTRSGYDRGHLAPAADMSFSVKTISESFYMSNMSPQTPQFNRGIWSKLEKQVRHFATKEKRIVVVTGPILPAEKTNTIGANRVTVPEYYYKVIYDTTPPEKMVAFVLPNRGSKADLRTFTVTVDRVEELTGLDFFSTVPQPKQEQLEQIITVENWDWIR